MPDIPFTFALPSPDVIPSHYDRHIQRHLSALRGQFLDMAAFEAMLAREDTLLYEVYEIQRPQVAGELLSGISIVHPGKVGREFFMTKGHYHAVLETAEVYLCMKGEGFMVMENPEGEWAVDRLAPGHVLYVPPLGAPFGMHFPPGRPGQFFIYPGNSGARLRQHRTARFSQAGAGRPCRD
jgi:glucose-6-phosphate isomerase